MSELEGTSNYLDQAICLMDMDTKAQRDVHCPVSHYLVTNLIQCSGFE